MIGRSTNGFSLGLFLLQMEWFVGLLVAAMVVVDNLLVQTIHPWRPSSSFDI